MAQIATVAAITGTGKAFAVNEQGVSRELKAGDVLQKGETIRTVGDVQVELLMDDGRLLAVAPGQVMRLDDNVTESDQRPTAQDSAVTTPGATAETVIQALERGADLSTELEATAAGLGGGAGADGGLTFVQLLRITEGVDPLAYDYSFTASDLLPDLQAEPLVALEEEVSPPEEVVPPEPVTVAQALLVEEESVPANGGVIGNDEDDFDENGNLIKHFAEGSVWSGGASGVLTTITIDGFVPVTVAVGGSTVFFDQNGDPIPSDSEATAAAQLTVNPDGTYTFTMLGAMSHEPVQGENLLNLPLVVLSGTASDGAPTTVNLSLSVRDDVPVAALADDVQVTPLVVDESPVDDPETEADEGDGIRSATADFTGYFATPQYGADGAGSVSYAVVLTGTAVGSGLYAVDALADDGQGDEILLYTNENGDVEGRVGDQVYFTISVDNDPDSDTFGQVTFAQTVEEGVSVWHSQGGDEHDDVESLVVDAGEGDVLNSLQLVQTVTDADGDIDKAALDLGDGAFQIEDDGPSVLAPAATHIIDLATSPSVTAALNFEAGSDGVGSVKFTFIAGEPAMDANGNQLSFNGEPLYLQYGSGGADLTRLEAKTADGDVGFWIDIDPTANTYTLHSNGVIENGTAISSATVEQIGGGNKEWKAFINLGGTQEDAFLSTKSGDSVNTNAGEIGISTGNSFEVGEGLRIDFVNGLTTAKEKGDDTYTFNNGSHNLTNAFRQIVSFTNQGNANITLSAIIANDLDAPFYGDADDVKVNLSVSDIKVYDATGKLVTTGLTFTDNTDGSITVNGIQQGWTFEINSETAFNAVQIDAAASSGQFKLGVFSYGEASDGTPIELNYGIVGTDGDGDAIDGTIDVTMYPAGPTIVSITDTGETLTGTSGTDYILAGDGNDTLIGGAGDDILVGGGGADVFQWNLNDQGTSADPAVDTIKDFTLGSGGDQLDLRDLLDVAETTTNWASYLQFELVDGKLALAVDHDGGSTFEATQKIVLDNYSGTDLATVKDAFGSALGLTGSGFTDADIINKMIADGHLKTDM